MPRPGKLQFESFWSKLMIPSSWSTLHRWEKVALQNTWRHSWSVLGLRKKTVGIGEAKQPPSFPIMDYCHPQYIYRAAIPYDFWIEEPSGLLTSIGGFWWWWRFSPLQQWAQQTFAAGWSSPWIFCQPIFRECLNWEHGCGMGECNALHHQKPTTQHELRYLELSTVPNLRNDHVSEGSRSKRRGVNHGQKCFQNICTVWELKDPEESVGTLDQECAVSSSILLLAWRCKDM